MQLRGFQPSCYPNRMRSSREGCSCSHCSFQTEAFHPAAFTLIQNQEGDSTAPLLLPALSMSKQTLTPQEHSFTWRRELLRGKDAVTQCRHQQHPSLHTHLYAQISLPSGAASVTQHQNHSIHHTLGISFLLLTAMLHGNGDYAVHSRVCLPLLFWQNGSGMSRSDSCGNLVAESVMR